MKSRSVNHFTSAITRNSTALIGVVLILLVIIAIIMSPYFFTVYNLQSLMRDISLIGLVAIGQSLLLLIGELDLSVGAMASLSGILGGLLMTKAGFNPYLSFLIGLLAGLLFGVINGLVVTKLKLSSMVVTIGMQGVYSGITLVITKGQAITQIPEEIFFLGKDNIGIIPIPFIVALIVMGGALFFALKSKTGRYLYAIGNSKPAASILGIKVDNIRVLAFGIMGLVAALAGMLSVARLGSAQASVGTTWAMNSIAASVIGGVLLTGGVGNPLGAFIGAAIISLISNVIVLVGVNIYWQSAVSGVVVVLAIALPSLLNIIREKRRGKGFAKKEA